MLLSVAQGVIYLLLAPLVVGTSRWAKARLERRQGPTPLQYYRHLLKLAFKQPGSPNDASWLFLLAPALIFSCYALPGFLQPVFVLPSLPPQLYQMGPVQLTSTGDLVLLIYLLGLARLTLGLAGMDTGAPFGGLGSSRELFVHTLVEPTLLLSVCALAVKWHSTDLTMILCEHYAQGLKLYQSLPLLVLLLALSAAMLAEVGRLPFDNAATPLELTMTGRAIYLAYSGPQLALLEWAEALRLSFFLTLLVNLYLPWLMAVKGGALLWNALAIGLYPLKLFVLALILALWEATRVRRRLRSLTAPALTVLGLAVGAVLLAAVDQ